MRLHGGGIITQDGNIIEFKNGVLPFCARVILRYLIGNYITASGTVLNIYTMGTYEIRVGKSESSVLEYSKTALGVHAATMTGVGKTAIGNYASGDGFGVTYTSTITNLNLFSSMAGITIQSIYNDLISVASSPPETPVTYGRYLISASPSGDWADKANRVASWDGNSWSYTTPANGLGVSFIATPKTYMAYNGSVWFEVASRVREFGLFTYGYAGSPSYLWADSVGYGGNGNRGNSFSLAAYISANGPKPQFDYNNIDISKSLTIQWNIYVS